MSNINKSDIFKFLFVSAFVGIAIYSSIVYLTCQRELNRNKSIIYKIEERIVTHSRGTSYSLKVNFNNKIYNVDITSKVYEQVEANTFPKLFYNSTLDLVFEKWKLTQSKRIALIFSIMGFAMFFLFKYKRD